MPKMDLRVVRATIGPYYTGHRQPKRQRNLIIPDEATVKMAAKYPHLVTGFVCQKRDTFVDPGLIQLQPGVQLESSKDDLGQIYNTPEKVILENGADVTVVGRGIVKAKNPKAQAIYKDRLWECYKMRVTQSQ